MPYIVEKAIQNITNNNTNNTYTLDEKLGQYVNIYDTTEIHPGMSAYIYVAFEAVDNGKPLYLVYDTGYWGNEILGTVYVER